MRFFVVEFSSAASFLSTGIDSYASQPKTLMCRRSAFRPEKISIGVISFM